MKILVQNTKNLTLYSEWRECSDVIPTRNIQNRHDRNIKILDDKVKWFISYSNKEVTSRKEHLHQLCCPFIEQTLTKLIINSFYRKSILK